MQKTHVSATVLGRWVGCSSRTIREYAERGLIARTAKGQYDLEASVTAIVAHLRTTAAGRGGEKQSLDYTAEKARLAKEQADGQAIKNAQLRGELIHVEDVAARWEDITSRVRTGLLAIPARISHRHSIDQELLVVIDREIRDSLDELSSSGDGNSEGTSGASSADETEA